MLTLKIWLAEMRVALAIGKDDEMLTQRIAELQEIRGY